MKPLSLNEYALLAVRVSLGLLLVVASIDKIADPSAFAQSIAHYKLLPSPLPMIVATVLPWMEFICGACLIIGFLLRGSAALSVVMFTVFTLAVLSALARNLDIACGCFTQDPDVGKVSWTKILENLVYLASSFLLYASNSSKISLENFLSRFRAPSTNA